MDDHRLRSILLNLQYRLSDNDRERLHFYLKNDVPRQVGDDSTLSGTLKLMQSLFDQEKISENDFTLLIDVLKQIRCFDAAKLLKGLFFFYDFNFIRVYIDLEHQRRMLLSGLNQSTQSLASMMPSLIDEYLDDHEDDHHGSTENCKYA
jgi:hypothetical protein